ncbi:MAG: AGE family epimerase/isomerase [Pseudomonadota bacterium]
MAEGGNEALKARADKARRWMMEEAFPLWARVGLHPAGGFQERLGLSGEPLDDPTSRVRLQARQTFCFSYARALGWDQRKADMLIAEGVRVLARDCRRADGIFGKQVRLGEGLSDDRADLYDTAFALLGFTTAAQTGNGQAKVNAARLNRAIDSVLMRRSGKDGFFETLPEGAARLQNPHMHLFEASLAYYAFTKDQAARDRLDHILALISQRFFDEDSGHLHEKRAMDWGEHPDNGLEAGHHYEWVWLLDAFTRVTGAALPGFAKALYETACALTDDTGRIALGHDLSGNVSQALYRTWSQTEALKAHLVAFSRGWTDVETVTACFDLLWQDHIAPAPAGAWIDRVDSAGRPAASDITAATGYHIYLALDELLQVAAGRA